MVSKIRHSLKLINYRLFLSLLLMGLLPTIYTTARIFFIGQIPGDWGFNIASQLSWVNLLYEVIQEALILPLFFFIGKALTDKAKLQNKVRTGLIITFIIYTLLSLVIIFFANSILKFMAQDSSLLNETAHYIRLETVANIFSTMVKFCIVVLITIKKDKYLYYILGLQMVLSILLDIFFVSQLKVSLKLGVNGIAYTNIIVGVLLLALSIITLSKENIKVFSKEKLNFAWIKNWGKIGGISGIESFVRNFAFMMMIIRMVNVVGEQGTFWVANNFIWGWLLLPVLQLGEIIKRDCGESEKAIENSALAYFFLTTIFVLIWAITIPLWTPFLKNILQITDYSKVFYVVIISIGFYVLFAYNNVIDSIFYGIGKTNYMLFQSLVINILFYGTAFILYIAGIYQPTLTKIALMFAAGTAADSILTFFMFKYYLCKSHLTLKKSE